MSEKIYTIPVSEGFEECIELGDGCPFCRIFNKLETEEIDITLGASLMEPDTRIQTNKKGFCQTHYSMLLNGKNKLGLGLITESHLSELINDMDTGAIDSLLGLGGGKIKKRLHELDGSCYICDRIEYNFDRMISNAALFFTEDEDFRNKVRAQKYICLPHLGMWLEAGKNELGKKFSSFANEAVKPTKEYLSGLKEDVSLFCKKFDYRFDDLPWGNSKDATERASRVISGDIHRPVKKIEKKIV